MRGGSSMKRVRNQGLTLVELLVSIAVLSIVTLGIGGLLRLAATQYSNATKETEVQNLTQATVASLTNAMEDVALDISFNGSTKTLTIANDLNYIKFMWSGSTIYYDEHTYASASTDAEKIAEATAASVGTALENVLCDHVQNFSVDTAMKDNGMVVLNLTVIFKERSKSIVQNVYLRNFHSTAPYIAGLNGTGTPTPAAPHCPCRPTVG